MTRCARSTRPSGGSSTRTATPRRNPPKRHRKRPSAARSTSPKTVSGTRPARPSTIATACATPSTKELAERKADLKERQTDDLRERQRDACDALREVRDVQYQELLQRQRDERAAFKAGETLEALGIGRDRQDDGAANRCRNGPPTRTGLPKPHPFQQRASRAHRSKRHAPTSDPTNAKQPTTRVSQLSRNRSSRPLQSDSGRSASTCRTCNVRPKQQSRPAAASAISRPAASARAASYLADQLGELFAPTPPEVREAQAKADAKAEANREAERPAREDKAAAYDASSSPPSAPPKKNARNKGDAWWKERDRGKGFERDQ